MQIPNALSNTVDLIHQAREKRADDGFRPHLGASMIGAPCSRALWYSFRWIRPVKHPGRLLRLFETGQLAEHRFIDELRWIGCDVSEGPAPGQQWRFSAVGGHFGGSMDAALIGLPESPATWHVAEFKTHNDKSFKDLQTNGVEKAKYQHYAQMQIYMALSGMDRALYLAANKNDDALYSERIKADPALAEQLINRAALIIYAAEPPLGISQDPAFYQCKWCDYHGNCHGTDAPLPTCRSCAYVTPEKSGNWSCDAHKKASLTVEAQKHGCDLHRHIPILLDRFAEFKGGDGTTANYVNKQTGNAFNNGEGGANDYSSFEIYYAQGKAILGDPLSEDIRAEFDPKIVEAI